MKSMADLSGKMQNLSGCVEMTEERQKEAEVFSASLHSSYSTRRRASPRGSHDPDQEGSGEKSSTEDEAALSFLWEHCR